MRRLLTAVLVLALFGAAAPTTPIAAATPPDLLVSLPGSYEGQFDLAALAPLAPTILDNWVDLDVAVAIDESADPPAFVVVATGNGAVTFEAARDGFNVCITMDHTIGPLEASGATSAEPGALGLDGNASIAVTARLGGCGGDVAASATQQVTVTNFGIDEAGFGGEMGGFSTGSLDVATMTFDGVLVEAGEAAVSGAPEIATPEPTAESEPEPTDEVAADPTSPFDPLDANDAVNELAQLDCGLPTMLAALDRDCYRIDPVSDLGATVDGGGFAGSVVQAAILVRTGLKPETAHPLLRSVAPILIHLIRRRLAGDESAGLAADRFAAMVLDLELAKRRGDVPS